MSESGFVGFVPAGLTEVGARGGQRYTSGLCSFAETDEERRDDGLLRALVRVDVTEEVDVEFAGDDTLNAEAIFGGSGDEGVGETEWFRVGHKREGAGRRESHSHYLRVATKVLY